MTYLKNGESTDNFTPHGFSDFCFGCGKRIEGPTVRYDGYLKANEVASIFMHRDCAFAIAQRLIIDTWPNRRDGTPLTTNC